MSQIDVKILGLVNRMTELQKLRLIGFIESFISTESPEKSLNDLLKFAGSIPKEDLASMEKAMEEDCNKIDI